MENTNFLDFNYYRYDLLNFLIRENNFKKYLEIGCNSGRCYDKVFCESKTCVDPNLHPFMVNKLTYNISSDDFFKINCETFDLIFIDGLHVSDQVYLDIENSLKILNDNGVILLHDCLPKEEIHQRPVRSSPHWNGDVWKALARYRSNPNLFIMTVNTDEGLGFIKKGKQIPFNVPDQLNFEFYKNNCGELMNVVSVNTALNTIKQFSK